MLSFLREELTSLPKKVRSSHGVLLAYSTPSQRVPCTPSGVCGSGQTMHTRRFRGYVHERAILGRCNTRHCAHLDRREVGGESEGYARCRRCRVASIFWVQRDPGMRLGLPKARVRNAFTCAATPGPYMAWHGAWRIWWARGGSLKHVCARYERCHCEHHIWLQRVRGTLLAWPKHACGAFLRRAHEHTTQDRWSGAALDMLHFDEREVARSSKRCARSRKCRMLWARFECKGVEGGVWAGPT